MNIFAIGWLGSDVRLPDAEMLFDFLIWLLKLEP
jgi:hypothetical protein